MQSNRVNMVFDQCRIHGHPEYAWHCGNWHRAGLINETFTLGEDAFIDIIWNNRLICWYRIFSKGSTPPPISSLHRSCISIYEWVPGLWPTTAQSRGWKRLGQVKYHGITAIDTNTDHTKNWSSHARRHLSIFKKSGVTLELGTIEDIEKGVFRSQVPKGMAEGLLRVIHHRLAVHPETIEILIAKQNNEVIAGFVCANDDVLRQSMYLLGYFLPKHAKLQAMSGLIDWWMLRSRSREYTACNFGGMCGAFPSPWDPWLGLSNFKTHFDIARIWLPSSFWKIYTKWGTGG